MFYHMLVKLNKLLKVLKQQQNQQQQHHQFTASMINPMETTSTSSTNATIVADAILASRLKVYAGIAELATKRYKLAARHFLGVTFDHCANNFQVKKSLFISSLKSFFKFFLKGSYFTSNINTICLFM